MRAANAKLNGEWGAHVKPHTKRLTAKLRRQAGKAEVKAQAQGRERREVAA